MITRKLLFWGAPTLAVALLLSGCPSEPPAKPAADGASKPAAGGASAAADPASKPADGAASKPGDKKADGKPTSAPASAAAAGDGKPGVYFAFPPEGAKVRENFEVAFAVKGGLKVVPAGESPDDANKGHHHLIIDGKVIPKGQVVPADDTHIHFGKGQTSTKVKLAPGKHTLTMQFADGAHRSYGEDFAATLNVEVVAGAEEAKVSFTEPADGAKVKSPVKVGFKLEGMKVRPAGEDPLDGTSGHHHVIIDGKPVPLGTVVPADDTHIHYGKGQTEAELKLAPGKHTLTMQLADGAHRSYGPSLSSTITIEVVE